MNDNNNEYTWRDESINEKRKSSIVEAVHTRSTMAARFIVIVFIFLFTEKANPHKYVLSNQHLLCFRLLCKKSVAVKLKWKEKYGDFAPVVSGVS